jgi:predicted transcriptional regulator
MPKNSTIITFRVNDYLLKQLVNFSDQTGDTYSSVIRRALTELFFRAYRRNKEATQW